MVNPVISIIVPVYRTPPPLLRRFLRSALDQTFSDLELIAVDDASPDECPRILDELAAEDDRVAVRHRSVNGRAGLARSDGMDLAKGEFLLFADADDVMRPDMCETLLGLARRRNADVVACSWVVVTEDGKPLDQISQPDREYRLLRARDKTRCYRDLNYALWNKLFRHDAIASLRFKQYEVNIGEDTLFNVAALCRARNMVTTSYVGYEYTMHATSATGRAAKGMPYLETIALSEERIREALFMVDGSAVARECADWLALKRFTTGCEWIAENPDPQARRDLWAYWRRYLRECLLPALEKHRLLAAWFRLVAALGTAGAAEHLTRIATRLADPVSVVADWGLRSGVGRRSGGAPWSDPIRRDQ